MKSVFELYQQYWVSSAILAAANLGVADAVDAEPRDARDIAAAIGADAEGVHRLLRGLATVGIFREASPGCFVATELSAQLRDGAPGDARSMIRLFGMKTTRQAMTEYEHAIRTGESAFGTVHGVENPFELDHGPVDAALYNDAMSIISRGFAKRLARFSFAGVARLVDVGGGTGTLLGHILRRTPAQHGVLFDLPEVVAGARAELEAHGVLERCTIEAGDMRERVPAGGDGYILKNVLHGWPDDDCVALLRRVREASAPGGRVFVIENVMPEGNDPAPCKTFDLFLLLGGSRSKVRSRAQFGQLFERAGLALAEVTPIVANDCVVEARALP